MIDRRPNCSQNVRSEYRSNFFKRKLNQTLEENIYHYSRLAIIRPNLNWLLLVIERQNSNELGSKIIANYMIRACSIQIILLVA